VEPEDEAEQVQSAAGPSPGVSIETFWFRNYRYFCWVLMAVGANLDEAEDTISRLIVDMHEKHTWDGGAKPKAWFRQALVHTYIDQWRRWRRGRELEIENYLTPEAYLDDGLNVWEDRQWAAQMLASLPPTQRTVVELILCEMSASEIADLLGKTPDAIRQNLAHARRKLRAKLGTDYQIGRAASRAPVPWKEDTP
jgi:RNA polymerase sigma-70 factor (ECF subfamily)